MKFYRKGKTVFVSEDIEKLPAPDESEPDVGPFQLVSVFDRLVPTFNNLVLSVRQNVEDVSKYYKDIGSEIGSKLVEFSTLFKRYIEKIKELLSMLVQRAEEASSETTSFIFLRSEADALKRHRQEISSMFRELIEKATDILKEGENLRGIETVIQELGSPGYEAAAALVNYVDTILKDPELRRLYSTEFVVPTIVGQGRVTHTITPLIYDFEDNTIELNNLSDKVESARLVKKTLELAKEKGYRFSIEPIKARLDEFRSFVRSSYKNYAFWKYADRRIKEIEKLDGSDPIVLTNQLKNLFRQDSSIDDVLYKDMFISLLQKFLSQK